MERTQLPSVAGMFYPADPTELSHDVRALLAQAGDGGPAPKALIAPHAGYIYSGPVAASAYARLRPLAEQIERVVLFAPSHRVPFVGIAASSASRFRTPLGDVAVDRAAVEAALRLTQVKEFDLAFEGEHALEVQLPFLQLALGEFRLVPFVVGDAEGAEVAEVIETLWGGAETLIVVSSDLSHYLDYASAKTRDRHTTTAIEALDPAAIDYHDACGRTPVQGLLLAARRHGLQVETVDLRNSGDTAGPKDRVVGYGAYLFH
jgi:AmmeMemoRadiSam system protein B